MKAEIIALIVLFNFALGFFSGIMFNNLSTVKVCYKRLIISRFKRKVKECFDDVDWTKQVFYANGYVVKNPEGGTKHYRCEPIDEAIKKLNKLLGR
jgi:hypothetical protein